MIELSTNIKSTDGFISYYAIKDTIYSLMKTKSLTYQDYKEKKIPNLSDYTTDRATMSFSQYSFDNLVSNLGDVPIKYNVVLNDLRVLNNEKKRMFFQFDKKMELFVEKNLDYQLMNFAWFAASESSQEQLDKKIHYMLNDSIYRNVANRYNTIGSLHLATCLNYRKKAIECYQKIATLRNMKTVDDSFRLDSELSKNWLGSWKTKQRPDAVITFYEEDDQLHIKNVQGFMSDIYMLSKNKAVDQGGNYLSLTKENEEYVFKVAGFEYRKVKE